MRCDLRPFGSHAGGCLQGNKNAFQYDAYYPPIDRSSRVILNGLPLEVRLLSPHHTIYSSGKEDILGPHPEYQNQTSSYLKNCRCELTLMCELLHMNRTVS